MIKFHRVVPEKIFSDDILWKLKRKEENFGIVKIKSKDLQLQQNSIQQQEVDSVKEFFKNGIHEIVDYGDRDLYYNGNFSNYTEQQRQIRDWKYFCKRVWMTDDYLREGKLEHPICVFWVPKFKKYTQNYLDVGHDYSTCFDDIENGFWQLYNGHARAQFLGFHVKPEDEVTVAAFNTFGKEVEFEKIFNENDDLIDYFGEGYKINITLNWGTAIPFASAAISTKVNRTATEYHRKIHEWFKYTVITSNIKLSSFNLHLPNSFHRRKIKGRVHLELVSELTKRDEDTGKYTHPLFDYKMVKACQILPLIDEHRPFYQEDMFTIRYTPA
jgi:hypothetical protein